MAAEGCKLIVPNTFIACGEGGNYCSDGCFEEDAFRRGAALAFGVIGMAEAIRKNAPRLVERTYWSGVDGTLYYDCCCPGCGVLMKARDANEDEGTDNEWCGVCRYA